MNGEAVTTIEREKKFLKRYKRNKAMIDRLKGKLSALESRIYTVRSPNLSGMPRGGDPVTAADLLSDKQELEDRIKRLTDKGHVYRSEILARIDELDDPRYADVLEAFFIDCKNFDEIADEIGFTERHVIRLYSAGVWRLSELRQEEDAL